MQPCEFAQSDDDEEVEAMVFEDPVALRSYDVAIARMRAVVRGHREQHLPDLGICIPSLPHSLTPSFPHFPHFPHTHTFFRLAAGSRSTRWTA